MHRPARAAARATFLIAAFGAAFAAPATHSFGQSDSTYAAVPEDVASIDAIIASLYDVISGPAGKNLDWDRMRSLFAPGAIMSSPLPSPVTGAAPQMYSVDEYIRAYRELLESTELYEKEIARKTDRLGNIVHVFSTFQNRFVVGGTEGSVRGINSIQLRHNDGRWWIVSILWDGETPGREIPPEYLPD